MFFYHLFGNALDFGNVQNVTISREDKQKYKMWRICMYCSLSIVLICEDLLIVLSHIFLVIYLLTPDDVFFFFSRDPICTLTPKSEHVVLPSLILHQPSGKLAHLTLLHPSFWKTEMSWTMSKQKKRGKKRLSFFRLRLASISYDTYSQQETKVSESGKELHSVF